jgi:hypothetical protein
MSMALDLFEDAALQFALNFFNDLRIVRLMIEMKLELEEHYLRVLGGEYEGDKLRSLVY